MREYVNRAIAESAEERGAEDREKTGVPLGRTVTNPVNGETAKWTASSIPSDWSRWRSQWEYSHAARFVLHWIGFSALLISLIRMSSLPSAHHGSV